MATDPQVDGDHAAGRVAHEGRAGWEDRAGTSDGRNSNSLRKVPNVLGTVELSNDKAAFESAIRGRTVWEDHRTRLKMVLEGLDVVET